jgi:hypothetical protein
MIDEQTHIPSLNRPNAPLRDDRSMGKYVAHAEGRLKSASQTKTAFISILPAIHQTYHLSDISPK